MYAFADNFSNVSSINLYSNMTSIKHFRDQTWGKHNINLYQLSLMMSKTIFKNTLLIFKYKNQNNSLYSYVYKTFTFMLGYYPSLTVLVKSSDINGTFAVSRI
jgi:hypothetical protein